VQLRVKDAARADLSRQVARSVAASRAVQAQFFVNDHWQLAIDHGAYGVHLGQEDLVVADLAAIRAAGLRLGLSSHAYGEVCQARALAPSYIACGPIHATRLKDMPWVPQGEGNLAHWCALLDTPVVAIGGIDVPRAHEAMRCGAAGVAVVSAITAAADPEAAVRALQAAIAAGQAAPPIDAPALARPTLAG
jgi:thiamine-phosphate diphosphorylase